LQFSTQANFKVCIGSNLEAIASLQVRHLELFIYKHYA